MTAPDGVIEQMDSLLAGWEADGDARRIFLGCYKMMTENMLAALQGGSFEDAKWVGALLDGFAAYYFRALAAYEQGSDAPAVWRYAFDASRSKKIHVLQNLVLGVNAHINYDLVFALSDVLGPEWEQLPEAARQMRYRDHCHVNDVIIETINAVQDQIVERFAPGYRVVDALLGPLDEWMTGWMISDWREEVWRHAVKLVALPAGDERTDYARQVEKSSVTRAQSILGQEGLLGLAELV